jgi:hypothetical protein
MTFLFCSMIRSNTEDTEKTWDGIRKHAIADEEHVADNAKDAQRHNSPH